MLDELYLNKAVFKVSNAEWAPSRGIQVSTESHRPVLFFVALGIEPGVPSPPPLHTRAHPR